MGKVARKALCDASDALIFDIQGIDVSFLPAGSSFSFNQGYQGYDLYLKNYGDINLYFIFYVDQHGEFASGEAWEGNIKHNSNAEEKSVLEDIFNYLLMEGEIERCLNPSIA